MEERAKILCVDDEASNLSVFGAAFEDDYEVFTASTAREAIKILRSHRVDIVISDQRMPEMTGVQLLEAIQLEYPDTVRFILTGFTDIEAIIQAINTGRVDQYITKPWEAVNLKVTIDRALELHRLRRRNAELVREVEARVQRSREVRELFQKYVPEPVVVALLQGGRGTAGLRGESRMATIMFVRIQRFQALTEHIDAKDLVQLINCYFTVMTRVILDHKGMANEFFADGILAVFGAPVSSLNNEDNAVRAALAMVAALDQVNEQALPLLGRPLFIGIGLHRGEIIAGNIGSRERMKYGVIGDTVNVAARIQAQTREEESDILTSASLKEWLDGDYRFEALGAVELRGKGQPIELMRVLGEASR